MVQQQAPPFVLVPNFHGGQQIYYTLPPGASVSLGQGNQQIFPQMTYPFPNQQVNYCQAGLFNTSVCQQVQQGFQQPLYRQPMYRTPLYQQPIYQTPI